MSFFKLSVKDRDKRPTSTGSRSSAEPPSSDQTPGSSKANSSFLQSILSGLSGRTQRSRPASPSKEDAPAPPRGPSGTRRQEQNFKEHVPSNLSSALQAAKDLGEIAETIPYIKAIAGLSLTLLKMWDEVQEIDERAGELIERIASRAVAVEKIVKKLPRDRPGRLQDLESDLRDYERLLESISEKVKDFKKLGSVQRTFKRRAIRETLDRFIRDLEHSDQQFTMQRLSDILLSLPEKASGSAAETDGVTMFEDPLPSAPTTFLGRDTEKSEVISLCCSLPNPHVAILGTGGMGKTTLAHAVLNDPAISSVFEQILFVSCEQVVTVLGILKSIADVLAIPSHERGPSLKRNVIARLRSTSTILCLDNFEDPWDHPSTRSDVEKFLHHLNGIPRLGLLLTMRGAERPSQVDWTHPLPLPLLPLPNESALELFYRISGVPEDDRIPKLLEQVENIPLIIELLARQINPPLNDLDTVLQRWANHGMNIFNRKDQSDNRLTSVTKSIDLSLQSPRILDIPHIYDALRMVAALPDGLSDSTIPLIQARLPPAFDLRHCLQELVHTSLCYFDSTKRYRLLAPIRQHVEEIICLQDESRDVLVTVFCDYANKSEYDHAVVAPELGNIRSCMTSFKGAWGDIHIHACLNFVWWEHHLLGIQNMPLAFTALSYAQTPALQARCRTDIARLFEYQGQYSQAEHHLRPALTLDTDSLYWDGQVQLQMGAILFQLNSYDQAESCLRTSVELFQRDGDTKWEGVALEGLGILLRGWGRLSEAENALEQSLRRARATGSVLAEGNSLKELGELYRLMGRVSEAVNNCQLAINCAQSVHSTFNEGLANLSLANAYRKIGNLENAEHCYLSARHLSQQVHIARVEALAQMGLGRVYFQRQGKSQLAFEHFQDALAILTPLQDFGDQAVTHKHFGRLLLSLERHMDAMIHFIITLAFDLRRLHWSHQRFVPGILVLISQAFRQQSEGENIQTTAD